MDIELDTRTGIRDAAGPLVTIIVPVYNRLEFLPQLANTIASQNYRNLEVVIVDDGSSDGSGEWVEGNRPLFCAPVKLLRQQNGGPYSARNHGLRHASGDYLAFLDSDDEWPAYHIGDFVEALEKHRDIGWIFGSIIRIRHQTRDVVEKSNFMPGGERHPFLKLLTETRGEVEVVVDEAAIVCALEHCVPGSMQCALIRKAVFQDNPFDESYRTTYDRFFALRALLRGFRFAWVERVHQIYHVHDGHISMVAGGDSEKQIESAMTLLRGYGEILASCTNKHERRAVRRRIAAIYSWQLAEGYMQRNEKTAAVKAKMYAVLNKPSLLYAKTGLSTALKLLVQGK